MIRSLLCGTLVLAGSAPRVLAAQYPGAIAGNVTDATTRAPLEGASITLVQTAFATLSDAAGRFVLRGLAPGVWTVRAERLGYATASITLEVQNGQTTRAEVALQPLPLPLAPLAAAAAPAAGNGTRLDRRFIEESGARTAGDAIRSVPGIVLRTTGPGGGQYVSIRGAPEDATLVLVDGVPVNDPVSGQADLSLIDAASIASITILPGAASARFGARAAAGVVLIEMRDPGSHDRQLTVAAGSLGARRMTAAWADGTTLPWTAGASWSELRGEFPFDLPAEVGGGRRTRENADMRSVDVYAAATVRPAGGRLDLRVAHDALARGLPGRGYAPSLHARQSQNQSRASVAWITRSTSADARIVLAFARQQIRHRDGDPPFGAPYDDTTNARTFELRADANRRVRNNTTLGIGAELRHLSVRSTALVEAAGDATLDAGAFVHGEHAMPHRQGQFRIAAQLRADRDPVTRDWTPSHSLTVGWSDRGLAAHLAHRSGFSPPTLGDRFFRAGVGVAPNPDLRAERVPAEIEAGIRLILRRRAGTASLRATAFRGNIKGMILWAPDFRFLWSPYNADVKRTGIEAAIAVASHSGRFRLDAAWAATRATYDRAGDDDTVQIVYRPRHTASVAAYFSLFATELSSQMRYTGQRNTAPANVNRLDGFWTLDVAISRAWQLRNWSATLDLRADRVLDEKDALIFAFPEPGRRLTLGLRLSPATSVTAPR